MVPYMIVEGVAYEAFEAEVARLIVEGYEPVGGPFYAHGQINQAMVLRMEKTPTELYSPLTRWLRDR